MLITRCHDSTAKGIVIRSMFSLIKFLRVLLAGTDTAVAVYNKFASESMDSQNVGIAAHIGGMATG